MKQISTILYGHAEQLGDGISQLIGGLIAELLLGRSNQAKQQVVSACYLGILASQS